jgi:biopolymer transport protein TolQ
VINIFLNLGIFAKIIIIILLFFSVISWGIIFAKWRLFRRLKKENEQLRRKLYYFRNLEELKEHYNFKGQSYFSFLFSVIKDEKDLALKEIIDDLVDKAGKNLPFLATASSVSPFLGLLGTVWGITKVFFDVKDLPMITLQAIAPGMADALITTIAGLLVAIPAVIAYNYFIIRLEEFRKDLEKLVNQLLALKNKK